MPAAARKPSPDDLRDRAQELRQLHVDPAILVLVNVWDAASARTVASVPGCRAIATASWAIAAAHGLADGEAIGREGMLEAVGCVASAVDLPVTADLEGGYGETPADVGETIARAIDAGAVGCNLEDGIRGGELLRDAEDAAARVAAARERADAEGVPIVINARTDVYLRGADDPEAAILRGQAYARAGADCVFVPGVTDRATIKALVDGIERAGQRARTSGRAVGLRAAGARHRARVVRAGPDGRRAGRAGTHGLRPPGWRRPGRRAVLPPAGRLTHASWNGSFSQGAPRLTPAGRLATPRR